MQAARITASFSMMVPLLLAATPGFGQCPSPQSDTEQLLARMERASAAQERDLVSYEGMRRYAAGNSLLRAHAEVTAEMKYHAPAQKSFNVITRSGSAQVQEIVIDRAMDAEKDAGRKGERENTDVNRRNYAFTFQGFDEGARAYVFRVEPRSQNRYLFRGKIWLDECSCAIQRVEGQPAQSPSFWIRRAHFVQEYEKFGDFWLPVRHESQAELRLFGRSSFIIDYFGYRLQRTGGTK